MKNKLEPILWKEGKFIDGKNKEVNPRDIGKMHTVKLNFPFNEEEIQQKAENIISNKGYSSEINSYMIGNGNNAQYSFITKPCSIYVSLGFYKI